MPETSTTSSGASRVRLISTRETPAAIDTRPEAPASKPSNPEFLAEVTAVLTAIAMLLSARLILLLSGVGGFVLAFVAVTNPTVLGIVVSVVYDLGIFCPLVFLGVRKG